jgi:flavorubredoxin
MVIGTIPASSEIQKRIRELLKNCRNPINIKDDILIFGKGSDHDGALANVLRVLNESGLTVEKRSVHLDNQK